MSQDNQSGIDKRKAPRVDTSMEVDYSTYSNYHIRRITNISKGGVFIRTQELLPVGSELDIRFKLPTLEKVIQSKVKVMWTYRQPASINMNSSGMGVQFVEIKDHDRQAIQEFVNNSANVEESTD